MQLDRAGRPFTPHHLATETQLCTGGDRVPPLQILQHRRGAPRGTARPSRTSSSTGAIDAARMLSRMPHVKRRRVAGLASRRRTRWSERARERATMPAVDDDDFHLAFAWEGGEWNGRGGSRGKVIKRRKNQEERELKARGVRDGHEAWIARRERK
ncbi:hypothetical protein MY10362_002825 [Beauveria mimosiformis]